MVSVLLGSGTFGPHAEPGERSRPIFSHVAVPYRLPSALSRPNGTDTADVANSGNWVSTSLSYPLHLVSEAAMTAD